MAARMSALCTRIPRSVWIEPGVQLQAALVRFLKVAVVALDGEQHIFPDDYLAA
jgi:hypothetical protein